MSPSRRNTLGLIGTGLVGALAGCLEEEQVPGTGNEETGSIADSESIPFKFAPTRPRWNRNTDTLGKVVVIDSEDRLDAVLLQYEVSFADSEDVSEFLEEVDFDTERIVLVESSGPNLCYDTVEISDVALEDDMITADAVVLDTSDEDEGCAEAVSYPSSLLRVTFEEEPVDTAAIDLTDGWENTSTVTGSVDDPLSPDPEELEGYIAPEENPTAIEPLECDNEDFERLSQAFDEESVYLGDYGSDDGIQWSLRADEREYGYGDKLSIRLTNVTDTILTTGNSGKFNLQVYTEDGWEEVRGSEDGFYPITDEAILHPPDGGFNWNFEFTEEGLAVPEGHDMYVCPDLQPGRYRFAFYGVSAEALTVEFDLVD